MERFYRTFKLLRELPGFPVGTELKWNCWKEKFTEHGDTFGTPPKDKLEYTYEEIKALPKWFEPVGEMSDYIPNFPDQKTFLDEYDGHWSSGSTRHNSMCRLCQCIKKLDYGQVVDDAVYSAIKSVYEQKYTAQTPLHK